jgi:hypothetical protein
MSFGGYETSFLISGIAMGAAGVLPAVKMKERLWFMVIGGAMIVYAFYVAGQSSGTFFFPVQLVALPWLILAKGLYDSFMAKRDQPSSSTGSQAND